jgi:hypothetical protein
MVDPEPKVVSRIGARFDKCLERLSEMLMSREALLPIADQLDTRMLPSSTNVVHGCKEVVAEDKLKLAM